MANNEWEWQERFTLEEQLRRIADNLISKRVEAWNRRRPEQVIVYIDLNILDEALCDSDEDEDGYDPEKLRMDTEEYRVMYDQDGDEMEETYERAFEAVKDDEELTEYVEAIRVCNDLNDICEYLGIDKKYAYNLNKRLLRKLRKASMV